MRIFTFPLWLAFAGALIIAQTGPARETLKGGDTELKISETATKDPAYLTPAPVEFPEAVAPLPEGIDLKLPFEGTFKVTNGYGFESDGWTHQTINNTMSANDFYALDIGTPTGTPVLAPADGRILMANDRSERDSYGVYMVIDHGSGLRSVYAHMSDINLEPIAEDPKVWVQHGDPEVWVKQGDLIGWTGSTGTKWPHLHFVLHRYSFMAESGADIGGKAVCPEPISGYCGIREGHELTSDNTMNEPAKKDENDESAEAAPAEKKDQESENAY